MSSVVKTLKYLASFIGVTPGSDDSGESKKGLSISKAGNRMLRTAFIIAAQTYTGPNKTGASLIKQRENLPADILAVIQRCDSRCRKVYWNLLLTSKKPTNVAKTATAREMIHFVWEAMMLYHQGELRNVS